MATIGGRSAAGCDQEMNGYGPCFRGAVFAEAFTGDDPLLRHVRTRVRSPQTNGVI